MIDFFKKNKSVIILWVIMPFLVGIVSVSAEEIVEEIIEIFNTEPKEDIQYLENTLNKILALRPAKFILTDEKDSPKRYDSLMDYGFITEEVEDIFPEWIVSGEDGYKRVRYGQNIQMTLIVAFREFSEQVLEKLDSISNGTADIIAGSVQTDTLCLDDICITRDELKKLLDKAGIGSAEAPTPIEPEPESADPIPEDPTPVDELPAQDETETEPEADQTTETVDETPAEESILEEEPAVEPVEEQVPEVIETEPDSEPTE